MAEVVYKGRPNLRTKLRPFQEKGVRKAGHFGGRMLLADDMGLGKTVQILAWLCRHYWNGRQRRRPVVVVCPANAKWTWERQCAEHCGLRAEVLEGRKVPRHKGTRFISADRQSRLYVINYDILGDANKKQGTWLRFLRSLRPGCVVIDECQAIKSREAKRTKAVRLLCKGVPHVFCLSGTPMLNRPVELWNTLNILRPDVFNDFWSFAQDHCQPRQTRYGWTFLGSARLDKLNDKLNRHVMIRRRKEDVLKELPPKTRSIVTVEIERRREYQEAEKDIVSWLWKQSKSKALKATAAERMVKVGYLMRLAARLKFKAINDWIAEFARNTGGHKLLVFGWQRQLLADLCEKYPNSVLINGTTPKPERRLRCERFNADPKCGPFFGNILSGGTAWSCTSSSTVLVVELDWVPGNMLQAEDRCHGLGRGVAGVGVNVYYMIARDTIETRIVQVLNDKQENCDMALDGKAGVSGYDIYRRLERDLIGKASKAARRHK
jgi:SWI/SNF-related matrix-associated actin-dependent regulator of chromatin subfamily A-like protein 1